MSSNRRQQVVLLYKVFCRQFSTYLPPVIGGIHYNNGKPTKLSLEPPPSPPTNYSTYKSQYAQGSKYDISIWQKRPNATHFGRCDILLICPNVLESMKKVLSKQPSIRHCCSKNKWDILIQSKFSLKLQKTRLFWPPYIVTTRNFRIKRQFITKHILNK